MSEYDWQDDLYYVAGVPAEGADMIPITEHEINWILRDMAGRIVDDSIEHGGRWADMPATESLRQAEEELLDENTVFAFPMESSLYNILFEWHEGYWGMTENISNFVTNGDYIFFTSADAYNSIGADLLGRSDDPNNDVLSEFDDFAASW